MTTAIDLNADETATAAWVARFLKACGVDRIFGLQGGHIQPSGITWRGRVSVLSTFVMKLRPCTWPMRTRY